MRSFPGAALLVSSLVQVVPTAFLELSPVAAVSLDSHLFQNTIIVRRILDEEFSAASLSAASEHFLHITEEDPFNIGAFQKLALISMHNRDYDTAKEMLDMAITTDPFNAKSYYFQSYAKEGGGEELREINIEHISNSVFESAFATGHFDMFYSQPEGYAGFYGGSETHAEYIGISVGCIADLLLYDEMQVAAGDYTNPHFATFTFSAAAGNKYGTARGSPMETFMAFKQEQVLHLKKLLSQYELTLLQKYYDELVSLHDLDPVEGVVSDRVGFFLNQFLKPVVEVVVGQRLSVTYSYFAEFEGGVLDIPLHVDNIGNEYTLSIDLFHTVNGITDVQSGWGFNFAQDTVSKTLTGQVVDDKSTGEQGGFAHFFLHAGDAVLYSGRNHPHKRDSLKPGHRAQTLMLHFAPDDHPLYIEESI